jgi:hypothetical protein
MSRPFSRSALISFSAIVSSSRPSGPEAERFTLQKPLDMYPNANSSIRMPLPMVVSYTFAIHTKNIRARSPNPASLAHGRPGTAVHSYPSDLHLNNKTFAGRDESFYAFTSEVHESGNKYKADAEACIRAHQPMNEEDIYAPCDTYQRQELDEAYENTYIDFSNPDDPIEQLIA